MSWHGGTVNNYEKTLIWVTQKFCSRTERHYPIFQHKQYTLKFFCNQPVVKSGYHTSQEVVTDEYEAEVNDDKQRKAEKAQKKPAPVPLC